MDGSADFVVAVGSEGGGMRRGMFFSGRFRTTRIRGDGDWAMLGGKRGTTIDKEKGKKTALLKGNEGRRTMMGVVNNRRY